MRNEVHQLLLESSWANPNSLRAAAWKLPGLLYHTEAEQVCSVKMSLTLCFRFLSVCLKKRCQFRCAFVQQLIPCGVSAYGWFMWLVDKVHTSSVIGRSGNCKGCNLIGWREGGGGMRWHRARQSNQWDSDMWAWFTCTHNTCKWECSKEKQKKQHKFYFFEGTI